MTTIVMRAAAIVAALILGTGVSAQSVGRAWPHIRPTTARFRVDFALGKVVIDLPLRDRIGRERYHFACRGVRESYLDSLKDNWVGPLMCTLAEGTEAREESLLSEDDSAAWFSRGQFRREDLVGECAKYPEFGVHRSFRLRGFRLTLDADHVVVDATGRAASFVLRISVSPDETARSEQAERPGFLDPQGQGRSCAVVLRGTESRMCRDWQHGGSWELCKR
jgi:hypothetical protein